MRLVVLTSIERGFASLCLPALAAHPACETVLVVIAEGRPRPGARWRRLRRVVGKVRRIGVRGALHGRRMRAWYTADVADALGLERIETVAARLGVAVARTPAVNDDRTVALLVESRADLGLSLGNAYIAPRVFESPRLGMLNVHHELLPERRGAASVIWAIHDGARETGYTIHRVDRGIDTGEIVARETVPIEFRPTLRETVITTYARLLERSAAALPEVCATLETRLDALPPQGPGRSFTTPSHRELRRIERMHASLRDGTSPPEQPSRHRAS